MLGDRLLNEWGSGIGGERMLLVAVVHEAAADVGRLRKAGLLIGNAPAAPWPPPSRKFRNKWREYAQPAGVVELVQYFTGGGAARTLRVAGFQGRQKQLMNLTGLDERVTETARRKGAESRTVCQH